MSDRPRPRFSLLDAARALARGSSLDAKLDALAGHAGALAGGHALVLLYDADADALSTADGSSTLSVGSRGDAIADAVRDHRTAWSTRAAADAGVLTGGSAYQAVLPLVVEDALGSAVEGVLLVATDVMGPDEGAREALTAISDLTAVAVRQARLHNALSERAEYLERLARTDPLTGLADRRTFEQMLELELARATRQGTPLAVALFDIDGLTAINADRGAGVGNDVLRRVAATIADRVRLIDTVARVGDDAFAVIAPGDAGGVVARRVRDAVAQLQPVAGVRASVSAAVVHHPADGTTGAALLEAAEAAIERARHAGPGTLVGLREPD